MALNGAIHWSLSHPRAYKYRLFVGKEISMEFGDALWLLCLWDIFRLLLVYWLQFLMGVTSL